MAVSVDVFVAAINSRQRLAVNYAPGARIIEPHAVGYGSSGQLLLRAFQTEGVSASGEHVNWKLMRLDRMVSAVKTDQTFSGPRPDYKQGDKVMSQGIIAELLSLGLLLIV